MKSITGQSVPDRWLEIRVQVDEEPLLTFVSEVLVEAGARSVQEFSGFLVTYFPPDREPEAFVRHLTRAIGKLGDGAPLPIEWRWQAHEDWETLWRQGLGPRRIGARLVVRPSWTPYDPKSDDLVLTVDPGIAFGTAEHGTTRSVLELLERRVSKGERIADVGTGTGILAMASVLLGADSVTAFDIDAFACGAARENAQLNNVTAQVEIVEGRLSAEGPAFDGVVANIEWINLSPMVPSLVARVSADGWLILGGILVDQRETALIALRSFGLEPTSDATDGDWWAVDLVRGAT